MPRKSRPWFRFYVEACHDPKLRRLKPGERWLWVATLAIARQSCIPGLLLISERENYEAEDIAKFADVTLRDAAVGLAKFERAGMLQIEASLGCWEVVNWSERQFESDDVAARVQRSRERRSNVATSSVVTPPETETDTENRYTDPLSSSRTTKEGRPQAVDKQERGDTKPHAAVTRFRKATTQRATA